MTLTVIFIFMAIVTLVAAVMTVGAHNLVHAALWLIVTLFGIAGLFALLEAEFLAVAQVVLYVGAIAILIIFAIMLTRRLMRDITPQTHRQWWARAVAAAALFGLLGVSLTSAAYPVITAPVPADSLTRLGTALVDPQLYALPFEVTSVLLVAALVGAVVIASDPHKRD